MTNPMSNLTPETLRSAPFELMDEYADAWEADRKRLRALERAHVQLRKALHELAHGDHSGRAFANDVLSETNLEDQPDE